MRGVLVTFEGVEGSGKSTQCRLLGQRLRDAGHDVVMTSEPDGTVLGTEIRKLFEVDAPPATPLTQALLFAAARQQHVSDVVRPALDRGAVVLSDRYVDATMAYQGFGQGLALETIRDLNALATGGVLPDLTILLDLDPVVGMARIGARRLDAFERMDLAFHRRVRDGYLELVRVEKPRIVVLHAEQDVEALAKAVGAAIAEVLTRRGGVHGG